MRNFLLVAFLVTGMAYADDESRFGVQMGLNSSNMSQSVGGIEVTGNTSRSSWTGGIFLNSPIVAGLSLQPELNYVSRGFKDRTQTDSLDYLTVPLHVKLNLPIGFLLSPYLLAGPELAFKIGSSANIPANTYKSFDVGVNLGVGVDLDITPLLTLGVTARYNLGLLNQAGTAFAATPDGSAKHKGLAVLATLAFGM